MNINYEYYRVFYYAAKYKSFTKAANVLFQNQPNITRIINKLEDSFGCKLFLRTHKGVTLTPEGEQLFSRVEIAHKQFQKAETEIMNQSSLEFGSITIGANETALAVLLLEKLRAFRKIYPNIRINITDQSTPQALESLDRGIVDFVVATSPANITKHMSLTELTSINNIMVCGPSFKHLSKTRQHLADLNEYPLIMLERNTMSYAFYNQFYLNNGISMRVDTETTTINQVLPMVKYDLGLGFLPEPFVRHDLKSGNVFKIDLYEDIPQRRIVLVQDTRKPESTAARVLIKDLIADDI
ncbi:MAG: LysR family transcriptional regulator [Candidatus Alectryocaccobium sp.]|jgi:DNA-binding transcriptional LysR family regulator|nr:LysR family transcriptional regulator [Lachnospiraceae bacterium]MDY6222220.1 LysR family transcriptional regulator [Candidatus Alectryocaccobium sp.]